MKADWKKAVVSGDANGVRALLAAGADVNALDRYGQTALMIAARKGYVDVARELISYGASLDHTAKFGLSALMLAVIGDHPEVVLMLVDAGADTTLRGSGRAAPFYDKTAAELAGEMGRIRCAEILKVTSRRR